MRNPSLRSAFGGALRGLLAVCFAAASLGCDGTPVAALPSDGGDDATSASDAQVDAVVDAVGDAPLEAGSDVGPAPSAGAGSDAGSTDAAGESAAADAARDGSAADGGGARVATKVIYVTASAENGNIGGTTATDSYCQLDPTDAGATFKALIVGATRTACATPYCVSDAGTDAGTAGRLAWVLAPDTTYGRLDGTVIGTTTSAGIFAFPLDNPIAPPSDAGSDQVWTGLNPDWTTSADTCGNNWYGTGNGEIGAARAVDATSIAQSTLGCASFSGPVARFYCVQQ